MITNAMIDEETEKIGSRRIKIFLTWLRYRSTKPVARAEYTIILRAPIRSYNLPKKGKLRPLITVPKQYAVLN